ncbi:RDD family protein [Kineococcus sp. SYSU DK005]|uniref:RDD family protein n=1 Tax=Kineococcus sp. SYSU DK005 TaxID=3383126 RepID=UPI003D7E4DD1
MSDRPPRSAAPDPSSAGDGHEVPGVRLGLPAAGSGSAAGWPRRFAGLAVDWVLATLIGRFLLGDVLGRDFAPLAVLLVMHWLLVSTLGMTIGHAVAGTAVRRLDAPRPVGFARGALRAVLLVLVLPAVVFDVDRRGLHDKAAGTVVVRR